VVYYKYRPEIRKGVFFMKKTFKILGIIALTAMIGFSMTACPHDTSGPPTPEYFITVTGIPPTYNGMIGAVKLYPSDSPDAVTVYSTVEKIIGNSVTLPLFNWVEENPWLGSGSFKITIFIFENRNAAAQNPPNTKFKGSISEIAITEATTTIEWSF
jgi:hypothetical protein